MKELADYRGDFDAGLRLEDFSKEALVKLMTVWGKLYLLMETVWQDTVTERHGLENSTACDNRVWEKLAQYEPRWTAKALGVEGNGVAAFLKIARFTPGGWLPSSFNWEVELKSKDFAVVTISRCYAVETWEKLGKHEKIKEFCNEVEGAAGRAWAAAFNPTLKLDLVKCPPRKSKDDCYCIWHLRLESDSVAETADRQL